MDNIIIAFTGPVGSGKTTLSKLVAYMLGWSLASFGTYVRKTAEACGFDKSRKGLQLAGNYLIDRGWRAFCEEVLADANWKAGSNLVLEGIRHLEALETLKDIVSPANIYLIYVSLDETERTNRLRSRDKKSRINLEELDLHPSEKQVKTTLFNRADFVVDNSGSTDKAVKEIVAWIHSLQGQSGDTDRNELR